MKQTAVNIWRFYLEGFRSMTLGRTLWLIILVKLFIMFFILRLFFFPRFLNTPVVGDDKEGYVSNELIHRSLGNLTRRHRVYFLALINSPCLSVLTR